MSNWKRKDIWTQRSNKFSVEVSRHTVGVSSILPDEGVNRWAVYAYIYPEHRLFEKFVGSEMYQDASASLPLHCGPSFLRVHRNDDGAITCYQVGADYHHLYDERFAYYEAEQDACEVFRDAQNLFSHLED